MSILFSKNYKKKRGSNLMNPRIIFNITITKIILNNEDINLSRTALIYYKNN